MADNFEQRVWRWVPAVFLAVAVSSCDGGEKRRLAEENAGLARKVSELTEAESLRREEAKIYEKALDKARTENGEERGQLYSIISNQQARIEVSVADLESARKESDGFKKRFESLSEEYKAVLKQLGDAPGWDSINLRSGRTMVGRVQWVGAEKIALELPDGLMVTGAVSSVSAVRVRVPGLTPDSMAPTPVSTVGPASPDAAKAVEMTLPPPDAKTPAAPVPAPVPDPDPAPAAAVEPSAPVPPPRVDLEVVRYRNQKIGESGKNALLQIQAPELALTVSNASRKEGVTALKARIWIVARGVQDTEEYQIVYAREESFSLEPGAEWNFRTEPRKITARQADKFAQRSGWELYGYLVRIEREGALLAGKASVGRLEKIVETLEGKKEGAIFRM